MCVCVYVTPPWAEKCTKRTKFVLAVAPEKESMYLEGSYLGPIQQRLLYHDFGAYVCTIIIFGPFGLAVLQQPR